MRARRRALAGQASGRVLDLGGADTHRGLWDRVPGVDEVTVLDGAGDARLPDLAVDGACVDTVFSVFQLAAAPDLDAALRAVRAVLADGGRILFLEPGSQVGVSGRLQRMVSPPLGGLTGWRADRDIPAELRLARLSVIDIRRHRVPTVQLWLRQVLEGVAHHALEPAVGSAPAPADPA